MYLSEQHVRDLRVEEAWYKTAGQVTIVYIFSRVFRKVCQYDTYRSADLIKRLPKWDT